MVRLRRPAISRPLLQLATVTVVIAVVTEVEEVAAAVIAIPIAMEVAEITVVIAFVGLCGTLHVPLGF